MDVETSRPLRPKESYTELWIDLSELKFLDKENIIDE